jgi:hypothetical protein
MQAARTPQVTTMMEAHDCRKIYFLQMSLPADFFSRSLKRKALSQ